MIRGSPASVGFPDVSGSSTLTWVLAGVAVYWFAIVALRNQGLLPSYVGTQGPILTIHTKRGRAFLDRLAGPKRFWRAWANLGVGIALVVMAGMFVFLLTAAIGALSSPQPASAVQQPRNALAIPGVNDFLPLSATPGIVAGLLVGLVVHEGGHGLLCRVEDIDIESMGVALLAVVPVGAFVQPDQESSQEASRGGQTRMFAAGVTNNFAVTLLAFGLLFGPVAGSIAVAPGAAVGGVAPGSPAADAGVQPNDRITAVDGVAVEDNDHLLERLDAAEGAEVTVERNGEETVTVERSLVVTAAAEATADVGVGDSIVAVDGQSVSTTEGLIAAVGDDEVVTLTVERADDGDRVDREVPIGAAVEVVDDGPLAGHGAPAGESLVITELDGERIFTSDELTRALAGDEPGETVTVAGYHEGERVEYEVVLGEHPQTGTGFLGILGAPGISGFSATAIGVQPYPVEGYLAALGGDGDGSYAGVTDTFLGKVGLALFLPLASVLGMFPFNFAGFTGGVENFYQAQGPLAVFGDWPVFALANALFWTGWINVQLGFFNCIPAFPLDGGHILRTSTEAVVSRLPVAATRGTVRVVTTTVGLTMLLSFLTMLFGPQILAG